MHFGGICQGRNERQRHTMIGWGAELSMTSRLISARALILVRT